MVKVTHLIILLLSVTNCKKDISSIIVNSGDKPVVTNTPIDEDEPEVITKVFAYSGSQYTNMVYSFELNKETGVLSPTAGVSIATQSLPMINTITSDKKVLLAANYSSHSVSAYSIASTTGDLSLLSHLSLGAGTNPAWIISHPSKNIAYTANAGNNTIGIIDITNTGTTSLRSSVSAGSGVTALAINPVGTVLYSVDQSIDQIGIYTIASDGGLTYVSSASLPASSAPNHAIVSPSGNHLYVGNWSGASVSSFSISGSTLTAVDAAVSTGAGGVYTVSITPDGKFLYAAKPYANGYSVHPINTTTGAIGASTVKTLSGSVNFSFFEDLAILLRWSLSTNPLTIGTHEWNSTSGVDDTALTLTTASYTGLYQMSFVEIEQ